MDQEATYQIENAGRHKGSNHPDFHPVVGSLIKVRRAARVQLFSQRSVVILAIVVVAALLAAILDYFLRFPTFLRYAHLVAGLVAAGLLTRKLLKPAVAFQPSLTDLALRIERQHGAKNAGLAGLLASGVDFARRQDRSDGASDAPINPDDSGARADGATVRGLVSQEAALRYAAFAQSASILERKPLWRGLGFLILCLAVLGGAGALAPALTKIGMLRTLAPWSDAQWPKRTYILSGTTGRAFALGSALPVRAVLVDTDEADGKTDVTLHYRIIDPAGTAGERQKLLMTPQGVRGAAVVDGEVVPGELYERLLDPQTLISPESLAAQQRVMLTQGARKQSNYNFTFEYWLETKDDESEPDSLFLVPPPAIFAARATVTPPVYASKLLLASAPSAAGGPTSQPRSNPWMSGDVDAAPAGPSRGVIGPVLAGSQVSLALTFNKPLDAATLSDLGKLLPGFDSLEDAKLTFAQDQKDPSLAPLLVLTFTATQTVRSPLMLTDEYGIASADDAAFRIEVLADRAPVAAIIEPSQDEAVLVTALVPVTAEGRDDVGISHVALVQQVAKVPPDSAGAPPVAEGGPQVLTKVNGHGPELAGGTAEAGSDRAAVSQLSAEATVDLSTLTLSPGDEVWLIAQVSDLMMSAKGEPAIESVKRRLRLIAESELIEQVQAELGGIREAARRAEVEQSNLSSQREQSRADAKAAAQQVSRQQSLGDRLKPMSDAVSRLSSRLQRNRLANEGLAGLLQNAGDLATEAKEQSEAAADALDRLATNPAPDRKSDPNVAAQADALAKAQAGVEEKLAELANILDRGQDDWVVRRAVEKLITQQQQLALRTQAISQELQGKKQSDLTPPEAADLARLAKEQMDLAQRSHATVASMTQRAEQMKANDPSQAAGLESAASTAKKEQVGENQEKAAAEIAKNNGGNAQRAQQQAEQTLKKMLKELDKNQERKDDALKRVLATVIESIQKLIAQQQTQLTRLSDVMAEKSQATPLALAEGMITLHSNTLGTHALVKQQVKEGAATLIDLLSSAGEAQTAAIVALRSLPGDTTEADVSERVSLTRLKEALEKAEELENKVEEREEDRKLDELKTIYGECVELQAAINAETLPLFNKELSRRESRMVQSLGGRQEELRQRLEDVRSKTQELADATLFMYAHSRYSAVASDVAIAMNKGVATPSVKRNQNTALRVLQSILAALEEAQKKKTDDFKEDEGGEEGGGGGPGGKQPLIPPIAELKLLRAMQAEAAERTRALEDAVDADGPAELAATAQLQKSLAENATALLEKLKQQQEPADAPPIKERN